MKIIFLDIDGVLNTSETKDLTPSGWLGISGNLVDNLARIVKNTGAKIVLTSTWKKEWNKDRSLCSCDGKYLDDMLKQHGLSIYDKIADHNWFRGHYILEWLYEHDDVESFVIIDDDTFDFDKSGLMPLVVKTEFYIGGLTETLADAAIEILNRKQEFTLE